MQIDRVYLEQAVRLKRRWDAACANTPVSQDRLAGYVRELENMKRGFERQLLYVEDSEIQGFAISKLDEIGRYGDLIDSELEPLRHELEALEDEGAALYDAIERRYPTMTQDEIRSQILAYYNTMLDRRFIEQRDLDGK